jgi:hypothetical protein
MFKMSESYKNIELRVAAPAEFYTTYLSMPPMKVASEFNVPYSHLYWQMNSIQSQKKISEHSLTNTPQIEKRTQFESILIKPDQLGLSAAWEQLCEAGNTIRCKYDPAIAYIYPV